MFVAKGSEDALLAGLDDAARAGYREAVQLTVQSDHARAWETLVPLLQRHPDTYALQHLACGLAMSLGKGTEMQAACTRAQQLLTANAAASPPAP
jgi:hypothetical protein